jgi:uncharacterized membrane protein
MPGEKSMKNRKATICMLGILLAFMAVATAADAPPLTFKFTSFSVPNATLTVVEGINNAGVTVGIYEDRSGNLHGFMLNGKKLTTIDDPKGTKTECLHVNANGALSIVGYYTTSKSTPVGFLYQNGTFTDVPGPAGATGSYAYGINDSGTIVGAYKDSAGVTHGYLLKGTTYTTLDVPHAVASLATGINNKGNIVLYWVSSAGAFESSLYNGKTYKTINVPKAVNSIAFDIDNAGDVVYEWLDSNSLPHGALRQGVKYYNVEFPKGLLTFATGINDHHVIVGGTVTTQSVGFKATYK